MFLDLQLKFRGSAISVVVIVATIVWRCAADDGFVEVEGRLRARPNVHYIADRRAFTYNGASSAKFESAKDANRLMALRTRLFNEAVENARKNLATFISEHHAIWESLLDAPESDLSLWLPSSLSGDKCSVSLFGCTVSDCAELFLDGRIYVAVTVIWSPEAAIAASKARENAVYLEEKDFLQLRTRVKNETLFNLIGPRLYELQREDGSVFVPVGAVAVDMGGFSGMRLSDASKMAEEAAARTLEQFVESPLRVVFNDAPPGILSSREENAAAPEKAPTEEPSKAREEKRVNCRLVFSGVVRDPTTGRSLYAAAYAPDCFTKTQSFQKPKNR